MKSRRKRLLVGGVLLVMLLIATVGAVRWYLFDRPVEQPGYVPPAPSASPAPAWTEEESGPLPNLAENQPEPMATEEPQPAPPESEPVNEPGEYGWPEDFELPLHIEVDVPEVPEGIAEPGEPIEEDDSAGKPPDRLTQGQSPTLV